MEEVLKDIKPGLSRLAVLAQPNNPTNHPYLDEVKKVGGALGVNVRAFEARSV